MRVLLRWGNVLMSRTTNLTQLTVTAASSTTQSAFFHSSPSLFEKWKNNSKSDIRDEQPSKEYIRYVVREKRADPKKALRNILINGGCSTSRPEMFAMIGADYADQLNKKNRIKKASGQAKKAGHKKSKRKHRREDSSEEDPGNIFHAKFGKQDFTFSSRHPETDFDWTDSWSWSSKFKERNGSSSIIGTYTDRKILDLPRAGPLRIEDVKAAFRSSALKWHPDRHQGSSQAAAEEKFKHCVSAYKSLCEALSDQ